MSTQVTRYQLATKILAQLGIGTGWVHNGAKRGLVAWAGAESGWFTPCDGVHGARFNVWNTTLFLDGCTTAVPYNSVPVQNYLSAVCGAEAVADTLRNTPDRGYDKIIAALAKSYNSGRNVLYAVADSGWGTFSGSDYSLADAIWSTYLSQLKLYNSTLVGP